MPIGSSRDVGQGPQGPGLTPQRYFENLYHYPSTAARRRPTSSYFDSAYNFRRGYGYGQPTGPVPGLSPYILPDAKDYIRSMYSYGVPGFIQNKIEGLHPGGGVGKQTIQSMTAFGSGADIPKLTDPFGTYASSYNQSMRSRFTSQLKALRRANLIFLDTETTGVKSLYELPGPKVNEAWGELTEIAISGRKRQEYGFLEGVTRQQLMSKARGSGRKIFTAAAQRLQNYTGPRWTASKVLESVTSMAQPGKKNYLVGHNIAAFDWGFLATQYAKEQKYVKQTDIDLVKQLYNPAQHAKLSSLSKSSDQFTKSFWAIRQGVERASAEIGSTLSKHNISVVDTLGQFVSGGNKILPGGESQVSGIAHSFARSYFPHLQKFYGDLGKERSGPWHFARGSSLEGMNYYLTGKSFPGAHDPRIDLVRNKELMIKQIYKKATQMDKWIAAGNKEAIANETSAYLGAQRWVASETLKSAPRTSQKYTSARDAIRYIDSALQTTKTSGSYGLFQELQQGVSKLSKGKRYALYGALGLAAWQTIGFMRDGNPIEGLHPGSNGYSASLIPAFTPFGSRINPMAAAMMASLVFGSLASGSITTGMSTFSAGLVGATLGIRSKLPPMAGFFLGAAAGYALGTITDDMGPLAPVAASVVASMGLSLKMSSIMKGGYNLKILEKLNNKIKTKFPEDYPGLVEPLKRVFPEVTSNLAKNKGRGAYVDFSRMMGGFSQFIDTMFPKGLANTPNVKPLARFTLQSVQEAHKLLSKTPWLYKQLDAYIGSPALAKAADRYGSFTAIPTKAMRQALFQDFKEALPLSLAIGGGSLAFGTAWEGLHPGGHGPGAQTIKDISDFGSGRILSKVVQRAEKQMLNQKWDKDWVKAKYLQRRKWLEARGETLETRRGLAASQMINQPYIEFKIPKIQEGFNTIEGLHPGGSGLGRYKILDLTDFGSKFNVGKFLRKAGVLHDDEIISNFVQNTMGLAGMGGSPQSIGHLLQASLEQTTPGSGSIFRKVRENIRATLPGAPNNKAAMRAARLEARQAMHVSNIMKRRIRNAFTANKKAFIFGTPSLESAKWGYEHELVHARDFTLDAMGVDIVKQSKKEFRDPPVKFKKWLFRQSPTYQDDTPAQLVSEFSAYSMSNFDELKRLFRQDKVYD